MHPKETPSRGPHRNSKHMCTKYVSDQLWVRFAIDKSNTLCKQSRQKSMFMLAEMHLTKSCSDASLCNQISAINGSDSIELQQWRWPWKAPSKQRVLPATKTLNFQHGSLFHLSSTAIYRFYSLQPTCPPKERKASKNLNACCAKKLTAQQHAGHVDHSNRADQFSDSQESEKHWMDWQSQCVEDGNFQQRSHTHSHIQVIHPDLKEIPPHVAQRGFT